MQERLNWWQEIPRSMVRRWPFARGATRLAKIFSPAYSSFRNKGAIGKIDGADFFYPPDCVCSALFWGLYERNVHRVLSELFTPDTTFVDIGAHFGWYSAYALKRCARVVACEPSPENAIALRRLASLNQGTRLEVEEVAIFSENGTAVLYLSDDSGWNTLIGEYREHPARGDTPFSFDQRSIVVPTMSLDRLFAKHKISGRVICKVDAEGAEWPILANSQFALSSIAALVVEVTGGPRSFSTRAKACVDLLQRNGFSVEVIEHRNLRAWAESDALRELNLLAKR